MVRDLIERQFIAIFILKGVTKINPQNFIEEEMKKTSVENGWLSKTGILKQDKEENIFILL